MRREDTDYNVICRRVISDADERARDSQKRQCAQCARPIWTAPSTLRLVALNPDTLLLCIECAMAKSNSAEDTEVILAPGAREELIEHFAGTKVKGN